MLLSLLQLAFRVLGNQACHFLSMSSPGAPIPGKSWPEPHAQGPLGI